MMVMLSGHYHVVSERRLDIMNFHLALSAVFCNFLCESMFVHLLILSVQYVRGLPTPLYLSCPLLSQLIHVYRDLFPNFILSYVVFLFFYIHVYISPCSNTSFNTGKNVDEVCGTELIIILTNTLYQHFVPVLKGVVSVFYMYLVFLFFRCRGSTSKRKTTYERMKWENKSLYMLWFS